MSTSKIRSNHLLLRLVVSRKDALQCEVQCDEQMAWKGAEIALFATTKFQGVADNLGRNSSIGEVLLGQILLK